MAAGFAQCGAECAVLQGPPGVTRECAVDQGDYSRTVTGVASGRVLTHRRTLLSTDCGVSQERAAQEDYYPEQSARGGLPSRSGSRDL